MATSKIRLWAEHFCYYVNEHPTTAYSPLYGDVSIYKIDLDNETILVEDQNGDKWTFTLDGKAVFDDGERVSPRCLLLPSNIITLSWDRYFPNGVIVSIYNRYYCIDSYLKNGEYLVYWEISENGSIFCDHINEFIAQHPVWDFMRINIMDSKPNKLLEERGYKIALDGKHLERIEFKEENHESKEENHESNPDSNKFQLKPFDKILIKFDPDSRWGIDFFAHEKPSREICSIRGYTHQPGCYAPYTESRAKFIGSLASYEEVLNA